MAPSRLPWLSRPAYIQWRWTPRPLPYRKTTSSSVYVLQSINERTGSSLTPQRAQIPVLLSVPLWKRQRRTESILMLTCCVFCRYSRFSGRVHQTRSLINSFRGTKECVNLCCSKTTPYDRTPALMARLGCSAAHGKLLTAYFGNERECIFLTKWSKLFTNGMLKSLLSFYPYSCSKCQRCRRRAILS